MNEPHVVIIGGGFGGMYAAKALGNQPMRVTLIDRRNFHLFQPLLYQVATGSLFPSDIASPLRTIMCNYGNIRVLMDEVTGIDPRQRHLQLRHEPEPMPYDVLIVAAGGMTHYFGHSHWAEQATGLKSLEDALAMRRKIFTAFELAEREPDAARREALMNFVIVGGGPTGVELAGAMAELAHRSMNRDFRHINPQDARIILVESGSRILGTYPADLSEKAANTLRRLGVQVRTETLVTEIADGCIMLKSRDRTETIAAETVLWAAGVKASPLGQALADATGCALDRGGRVIVNPDLSVPGHPEIFVIGDLAHYDHTPDGQPLPGVAPVAMQQGDYVARLIRATAQGKTLPPFRYQNKGSLAVIGINEAVADLGRFRFSGFLAWLIWAFVHIRYLIEFENRMLVMLQWAWTYFTRQHGARLITGADACE